ncbi:MAG: hypothetical protein JSU69_04640 [Candidatus Zixiibacteriota bacterium]|nr:MAG: hypothetical protein JSU69_04640 [candidate division Zixibacteria bacterium]
MNNAEIIELINKELDGLISDEEFERLNEILEMNPSARRLRAEHRKIAEKLATVEPVEPPSDLKVNILKKIDARKYALARPRSVIDRFLELWTRSRAAYAYSFVAGAAVGAAVLLVCLYGISDHMPLNNNELVGTVITQADSDEFRVVDKAEFSPAEASGLVTVRRNNGAILVRVDVVSSDEIELVFEFDETSVLFAGYERGDGIEIGTLSKEGFISVRHLGRNAYTLVFEDTGEQQTPITMHVYSDSLVFSENLDLR